MASSDFSAWLASIFGHSEFQVRTLLKDKTALHFLVAWSLFESKCFSGFVKAKDIEEYAKRVAPGVECVKIRDAAAHFHARYQDQARFENLMHGQHDARLTSLLNRPLTELSDEETLYLVVFVVYRYRNNIFHGNKGVDSWLAYRAQIDLCTEAMQVLISDAEQSVPTMNVEAA